MKHIYMLYFFISFLTGMVSLSIAVFLYNKTKETIIRHYIYFYSVFSLFIFIDMLYAYIRFNTPISPEAFHRLNYLVAVSVGLWMFGLPVFLHSLFCVSHATVRNVIFGGVAFIIAVEDYIIDHVLFPNKPLNHISEYIEACAFLGVFLYIFFWGGLALKKVQDLERKKLAKSFLILLGIGLPGMFVDTFLEQVTHFRFFSIFYCGVGIIPVRHFIKYSPYHAQILPQKLAKEKAVEQQNRLEEDLFAQYNLSSREQEIVRLVIQGYPNKQISETLFISLSTVKKHITSIYQKCDVKNRYELITWSKHLLAKPSLLPDNKEDKDNG